VADEAKDQPAADFIIAHEVPCMSAVHPDTIWDERLKALSDHVRAWMFAAPAGSDEQDGAADPAPAMK
jgi:hypothetical protein